MSDLFREEALAELHSRGGPGDVLRVAPRWLMWSVVVLFVLVGVGAAAALSIDTHQQAHGTALLASDGRSVRAVLPVAFRGEVQPGTTMSFGFGTARGSARITTVRVRSGRLLVEGRLASPLPNTVPRTGRATVRVDSETVFDLLRG